MRIMFPELFFSAFWFRGLHVHGSSIENSTLWVSGYCHGDPVARVWFIGEEYVWKERVI